jgi:cell division protein FtsL
MRYSKWLLPTMLIIISFSMIFMIKIKVQQLTQDVTYLEHQLSNVKTDINILQAEWAYLNQPERLKQLASKYLTLQPITLAQLRNTNFSDYYYQQQLAGQAPAPQLSEQQDFNKYELFKTASAIQRKDLSLQDNVRLTLLKSLLESLLSIYAKSH